MSRFVRFGFVSVLFFGVVFALPAECGQYELFFGDLARLKFDFYLFRLGLLS